MIRKMFASRSTKKFLRNKLAVFSMFVILAYVVVAIGCVDFFGTSLLLDKKTANAVYGQFKMPGTLFGYDPDMRFDIASKLEELVYNESEKPLERRALVDQGTAMKTLSQDQWDDTLEKCEVYFEELEAHFDAAKKDEKLKDTPEKILVTLKAYEDLLSGLFEEPDAGEARKRKLAMLCGTDQLGRSNLFRGLFAIKIALQIGLVTSLVSVILGAILGAAAAFFGGLVDLLVVWLYSTLSSIPSLVLLTLLSVMFAGTEIAQTLIPVYISFGLTFWIGPCRVVRGEVLKLKELEYIQAASSIGFGKFYILVKHLIPNTSHLMFVNFSLLFVGAIKSEVILSFLGLGVDPSIPSWGIMINYSKTQVANGLYWQIATATALMFGLVMAFNIVADALQDAFDPKHVG